MDYKRMKVMVTSGGTREYIDDVRVVTNISTGALGAKIAEEFLHSGAHVFFVHAKGSVMPVVESDSQGRLTTEQYVTSADLMETMRVYCSGIGMDAVIHSAAVSDFTFRRDVPVKVSSDSEEGFIEYLRQTIVRTPKIVKMIKKWCPDCKLVSFKFTVGKDTDELLNIALKAGEGCSADFVLANDKTEMVLKKEHVAYLLATHPSKKGIYYWLSGKEDIAKALVSVVSTHNFSELPYSARMYYP